MRERDVHAALVARIKALGGEVRRLSWLGRAHAPDVLVLLPFHRRHILVEEKRPGETPRPGQQREHTRLREAGLEVLVISTPAEIDLYFPLP